MLNFLKKLDPILIVATLWAALVGYYGFAVALLIFACIMAYFPRKKG